MIEIGKGGRNVDKIDFHDQPVEPQVDGSLQRLGLDYVDLFVLHGL